MNTKKKNARGITLIALVITIIVLLILAGVTINALSGENGIITKSKEAKIKTEKSRTIEKINLAILTAMTKGDGDIDNATLREELEKEGLTVKTEGNNLPWDVSDGKYIYRINEDYTVEEVEGINLSKKEIKLASGKNETITATLTEGTAVITIRGKNSGVSTTCTVTVKKSRISVTTEQIVANPDKYYGQVAQNYTAGGKTYRIFYIDTEGKFGDKNTVYLKADWTANDTSLTASYTPSGTDLETYKKLNPSWAAKRGSSTSSWNENEHAAAWLCSPSKWTTYCDTSKANYAIGAPTAEMYVASYNQVSHTTGNYKLGTEYSSYSEPGYIYIVNNLVLQNTGWFTRSNTLDYTGYNSMYCGKNGSTGDYDWWLASPSAYHSGFVCSVYGDDAGLGNSSDGGTLGACPLVSLRSSFQLEIEQ